jgi:phosphate starvation-inducible PhoH-like protein
MKRTIITLVPMVISTYGFNLLPLQKAYDTLLKTHEDIPIIFGVGPAGTGKTMIACNAGIKLLKMKKYDKIVITRPVVSVDEEIGFLPGSLNDKMAPWVSPLFDYFNKEDSTSKLLASKKIEIVPMAFMRGRTFDNTYIIGDEMQNSTPMQMKTLLTRIGKDSKLVITGDLEQSDLGIDNGLNDIILKLKKRYLNNTNEMYKAGIGIIEFDNSIIQRSFVVKNILDLY